jgi:hypothetical protein
MRRLGGAAYHARFLVTAFLVAGAFLTPLFP